MYAERRYEETYKLITRLYITQYDYRRVIRPVEKYIMEAMTAYDVEYKR